MNLRWWHAAAVLVALASIAPAAPRARRRVLLVGDSLAVGLGASARAEGALVSARGGTVARQWITRGWFAAALESARPELVLVSLGTNDAAGQVDAGTFAAQVAQLEQLARARGARVVWLFPPPMPYSLDAIRAGLSRAEADTLDAPAGLARAADRVHLTPAGYAAWWRAVAPAAFGLPRRERGDDGGNPRRADHPRRAAGTAVAEIEQLEAQRLADPVRDARRALGVVDHGVARSDCRGELLCRSHNARVRSHRFPSSAHQMHGTARPEGTSRLLVELPVGAPHSQHRVS